MSDVHIEKLENQQSQQSHHRSQQTIAKYRHQPAGFDYVFVYAVRIFMRVSVPALSCLSVESLLGVIWMNEMAGFPS